MDGRKLRPGMGGVSGWVVECQRNEDMEPGMFASSQGMFARNGSESNHGQLVVEGGGGRGRALLCERT